MRFNELKGKVEIDLHEYEALREHYTTIEENAKQKSDIATASYANAMDLLIEIFTTPGNKKFINDASEILNFKSKYVEIHLINGRVIKLGDPNGREKRHFKQPLFY